MSINEFGPGAQEMIHRFLMGDPDRYASLSETTLYISAHRLFAARGRPLAMYDEAGGVAGIDNSRNGKPSTHTFAVLNRLADMLGVPQPIAAGDDGLSYQYPREARPRFLIYSLADATWIDGYRATHRDSNNPSDPSPLLRKADCELIRRFLMGDQGAYPPMDESLLYTGEGTLQAPGEGVIASYLETGILIGRAIPRNTRPSMYRVSVLNYLATQLGIPRVYTLRTGKPRRNSPHYRLVGANDSHGFWLATKAAMDAYRAAQPASEIA